MPAGKRNALLYPFNGRSCSPVQLASCSQAPLWSQPEYSSSCSPGITFYLLSSSFRLKQYFNKWNKFLKLPLPYGWDSLQASALGERWSPPLLWAWGKLVLMSAVAMSLRNMSFTPSSCHPSQGQGSRRAEPHCHGLQNQSFHTFGSVASPELSDLLKSLGFFLRT